MPDEDELRLVTYCGLYCGLCAQHSRIPKQAQQLRQTLHEEGFDDFYQYEPDMKEVYPVFSRFLQKLAELECTCRTDKGGPPDCKIRECARQRNVKVCPLCKEYPCQYIISLAERYPLLVQDGRRMQKVGVRRWVREQKDRARRGFVYSDIRSPI
jgi:hypothetical protein